MYVCIYIYINIYRLLYIYIYKYYLPVCICVYIYIYINYTCYNRVTWCYILSAARVQWMPPPQFATRLPPQPPRPGPPQPFFVPAVAHRSGIPPSQLEPPIVPPSSTRRPREHTQARHCTTCGHPKSEEPWKQHHTKSTCSVPEEQRIAYERSRKRKKTCTE